jgi:hypothetical protein
MTESGLSWAGDFLRTADGRIRAEKPVPAALPWARGFDYL